MKKVCKAIVLIVISAVLGTLALTIVYLLPTEYMKNHVESSIEIFYQEETYPQQVAGYKMSQLDNETDAIMLLNAIYERKEEETPLKSAMRVPRIDFENDYSGRNELVSWLWLKKEPESVTGYARYWHGYLLFLKPLLLLLDYADIRILNMIIQLFLLAFLIISMVEKGYKREIIPLLTAIAVINPVAIAMSLQFSSIYYIVFFSLLFLCNHDIDDLMQKDFIIFTVLGIVTVFFDFLTYPMAVFGMAAVFMLVKREKQGDWKNDILLLVKWGFFWGIGYAGMWSCKWLISSLILHENIIYEVLKQASVHTSDVVILDEHYNLIQIVWRNIKVFAKWPYFLLGIGLIIYGLKQQIRLELRKWKNIIPFIVIAVLPILWLMILKSHSGFLYWYTYRGLMVTIFAILCGLQAMRK